MIEIKPGLEAVLWDFDGVLMNSNGIRDIGFENTLADYPENEVQALMEFHRANGGLSRYVKFRYFFEQIRHEKITEEEVKIWALKFSAIVKTMLLDKSLLIEETLSWIKENYRQFPMHIVSGSDEQELKFVCDFHDISKFFKDINGSPTPKKQLVAKVLTQNNYRPAGCLLVGDSHNDFEAADVNGILFRAYNNPSITLYNTY